MVEYIKRYVTLVLKASQNIGAAAVHPDPETRLVKDPMTGVKEIARELDSLNPRDFEPAAQTEFVRVRGNVAWLAKQPHYQLPIFEETLNPILTVLDAYRGPGSGGVTRQFPFLSDPGLRPIVERDYAELVVKNYPSGAWKSCVIMAGSVLEAILFDRLADPAWNPQAIASPKALRANGTPIPMDDWTLEKLIDVALDINMLPKDPANTIHQVLRDYRNFVHPKKEIRAAHACTEAEAMLSIGALDSVCNFLETHL